MSVVSVIVTYNPDSEFHVRLRNIADQSDATVVIDNDSESDVEQYLAGIDKTAIVHNSENVGVATAINQGITYAMAYGAEYVCLFDQDSEINPGFIQELLTGFAVVPNVGIVAANYMSPVSGRLGYEHGSPVNDRYFEIDHAITSGSMVKASILPQTGMMKDDLFIDYVDVEFSERLRGKYTILATRQSVMFHPIGEAVNHRFLNRTVAASNHSPLRRYYMARNCVNIIKENSISNLPFARVSLSRLTKIIGMVVLFEKDKSIKVRAITYGILDGLSGKMGKTQRHFGKLDRRK